MARKSNYTLAYTAGVFDGEGCISLFKRKTKTKKGYSYCLYIAVTNTNEWLLQWLKMQYGGSVTPRTTQHKYGQPSWNWSLTGKKARDFLVLILPHLNLKRPQAEIAITFQNRGQPKSDEQLALAEAERILVSNMKGRRRKQQ